MKPGRRRRLPGRRWDGTYQVHGSRAIPRSGETLLGDALWVSSFDAFPSYWGHALNVGLFFAGNPAILFCMPRKSRIDAVGAGTSLL
jgi:hypothetical protein